eukprot:c2180_g1_i1.p1 GENE.c2180_g1_i1~~c2180_g1_i1.p1  ORF type:complete len:226 (+),score=-45.67 c2180_g1_i1:3-680(+)
MIGITFEEQEISLFCKKGIPILLVYVLLIAYLILECICFPIRKYLGEDEGMLMVWQLALNVIFLVLSIVCHIRILVKEQNRDQVYLNSKTSMFYSLMFFIFLFVSDCQNSANPNQLLQIFIDIAGYGQHIIAYSYFCGQPLLKKNHRSILLYVIVASIILSVVFCFVIFLSRFFSPNYCGDIGFLVETCLLVQTINLSHHYFECAIGFGYFGPISGRRGFNYFLH